jgi:hypothetical protein
MHGNGFDDLYGSKYLSAADIGDGETARSKIAKVEVIEIKERNGATKRKWAVTFDAFSKQLLLNKTNATAISQVFGKDPSKWIGQTVEFFVVPTEMGDGIRVRPLRRPATLERLDPDLDDAIPI